MYDLLEAISSLGLSFLNSKMRGGAGQSELPAWVYQNSFKVFLKVERKKPNTSFFLKKKKKGQFSQEKQMVYSLMEKNWQESIFTLENTHLKN